MKKKGFTLVELLAVIAILAILVIIALPNVMKMFTGAKEKTFITEVQSLYRGAEREYIKDMAFSTGSKIYSKCREGCTKGLDMQVRDDLDYYIEINPSGSIVTFYARDNSYQYSYTGNNMKINDIKEAQDISQLADNEILDIKEIVSPTLPPGNPELGNYFNANKRTYYSTLNEALSEASSNQTIKVLNQIQENTPISIPSSVNDLKIDFNGNDVVFDTSMETLGVNNGNIILTNSFNEDKGIDSWTSIKNNGTITIKEHAMINSENEAVDNKGTLNIEGGSIHGREASAIMNTGTINMSSGYVGAYIDAINNESGTVNITGGEISAIYGIANGKNGRLTINDGVTVSGWTYAIGNAGTFIANGGTIKAVYAYGVTGIVNSGTATINDIDITTSVTYNSGHSSKGIDNKATGQLYFKKGTIKASVGSGYQTYGIYNEGNITIDDCNITATSGKVGSIGAYGIYNKGNATIKSGIITSAYYGIFVDTDKTLVLGTNDSSVSTTKPEIFANGTNGIGIQNNGIFEFYDGIIKGKSKSINGLVDNSPAGHYIHEETIDNVKISKLLVSPDK